MLMPAFYVPYLYNDLYLFSFEYTFLKNQQILYYWIKTQRNENMKKLKTDDSKNKVATISY